MSGIRNGNFETGDTSFWSVHGDGILTAQGIEKKYGSYAGKLVSSDALTEGVINNDFIEAHVAELYAIDMWSLVPAGKSFYLVIERYTSSYDLIEVLIVNPKTGSGAWTHSYYEYLVEPETGYIRLGVYVGFTAADQIAYFDNVLIHPFNISKACFMETELGAFTNLTDTVTSVSDKKSLQGFTTYYADLYCTSLTGTNPTLDVVVWGRDGNDENIPLGTFAQLGSSGKERIAISNCTGKLMYIVGTEGGSWTDCDFKVTVTGKR